jgi:hypothetical protein
LSKEEQNKKTTTMNNSVDSNYIVISYFLFVVDWVKIKLGDDRSLRNEIVYFSVTGDACYSLGFSVVTSHAPTAIASAQLLRQLCSSQ